MGLISIWTSCLDPAAENEQGNSHENLLSPNGAVINFCTSSARMMCGYGWMLNTENAPEIGGAPVSHLGGHHCQNLLLGIPGTGSMQQTLQGLLRCPWAVPKGDVVRWQTWYPKSFRKPKGTENKRSCAALEWILHPPKKDYSTCMESM